MITAYRDSARAGDRPAYIDWKLNTRWSRSSWKRRAISGPSRPKARSRSRSRAALGERSRPRGESKLASMKCGVSTAASRSSQSTNRSNACASRLPHCWRISSRIFSRPGLTSRREPSAKKVW
nr:hypothetical protein [Raineyella fluvialis]